MKKQGRPKEYEEAIVSIIKGVPKGTHLTAPEVYIQAKDLGLPVSISTVYRTLQRLKTEGNVSTVSGDRKLRYESAKSGPEHDHLICLSCGLTIEFIDERLPSFGQTVAKRKGFIHLKSRFDILGYCQNCCKSSNNDKKAKIHEQWQAGKTAIEKAFAELCKLNALNLEDQKIRTLIAHNQLIIKNLARALDNYQNAEKLLNRGLKLTNL